MHDSHEPVSPWLARFAPLIRPGGRLLDLACGSGRHARWLAGQGWRVDAVDRDADALAALQRSAAISPLLADLEGAPWPYAGCAFDAIVVSRYLHRPLFPRIAESLVDGGLLIYETFMQGQETLGRPKNPDFLLRPDELLHVVAAEYEVVAFEQGLMSAPQPQFIQRICARRQFK